MRLATEESIWSSVHSTFLLPFLSNSRSELWLSAVWALKHLGALVTVTL